MALIIPKSRSKQLTNNKQQVLTVLHFGLIVNLLLLLPNCLIDANQFTAHKLTARPINRVPPLYVINHQQNSYNLGHTNEQLSSRTSHLSNNGKLTVRSSNNESPITNGGRSFNRKAKQIVYTDEPVPYYHSYKHMGYGAGMSSIEDDYYQPLRRNQHFIMNDNVMGALYSSGSAKSTPSTKRVAAAPSTKTRQTQSGARNPQSSPSKTNNRRRFESPPLAAVPPVVASATPSDSTDKPINRANRDGRKNLVCYYGTWAVYRPDAGKFPVENIDPFLCTHVIYG